MEIFLQVLLVFLVFPLVGVIYVTGVHRLGAWIISKLPPRAVRVLSRRLYVTDWDKTRDYDRIALQAEDKLNKRTVG